MRKACVVLFAMLILAQCFGQQPSHTTVTVSGCVINMNGTFKTPHPRSDLRAKRRSPPQHPVQLQRQTGRGDWDHRRFQ